LAAGNGARGARKGRTAGTEQSVLEHNGELFTIGDSGSDTDDPVDSAGERTFTGVFCTDPVGLIVGTGADTIVEDLEQAAAAAAAAAATAERSGRPSVIGTGTGMAIGVVI